MLLYEYLPAFLSEIQLLLKSRKKKYLLNKYLVDLMSTMFEEADDCLIKFTYFDSCLDLLSIDILSLIEKKNILGFSVSF